MADDQERVKIIFDTNAGKAASDANKLAGSLDNVTDSGADATRQMYNLDASFDEIYGDIKPLTAQLGEVEDRLYQLAQAGDKASDEFKALTAEAGRLKKAQQEVDRQVDAAAQTIGQKLGAASQIAASGISAVTSGMALFGGASEETEKALLKVQAAMAFADSISSLTELSSQFGMFKELVVSGYQKIVAAKRAEIAATTQATIAQRLLNLTALANPYVALAAGIAAISVVTYMWIKSSNAEAKALEVATAAVSANKVETEMLATAIEETSKATEGYNTLEVARARALGASDKEIQKIIQSQKDLAVATSLAFASEAWQNVLKSMEAARVARSTMNKDLIKEAEDNQKAAEDIYKKANDTFNSALISEGENRLNVMADNLQKAKDAAAKALEERNKLAAEEAKKRNDEANEAGRLAEERYNKEYKDFANFRLLLVEAKVQADSDEHERVTENLNRITEEENARLLADAEQKKKIDEYKLEQKKVIEEKSLQVAEASVGLLSVLAGKSRGLQKAAIIAESAVGIGRTVQGVFTGNAAALAQGIAQAGPIAGPALATPAIILNSVQGALSVAGNIAATTKALQAVGGGSAPSAGNLGGGSAPSTPSVQFNNTSENQIATATSRAQASSPPIKVNVLESDITNAQDNVKVLESNNSF